MYRKFVKFYFDLFSSLLILILISPLLLVLFAVLYFYNNKQVFFIQERPGLNGVPFKIIKFKTMVDAFDVNGNLLSDDLRLTKVGSIIRKLSFDEILQLINVVKGEMSLVGPRPLLLEYMSRYNDEQAKRHLVKPGITGWAQVNGRNAISWQKKFELDIYYVNNLSFSLDMKIIFLTIKKVLKRSDINKSEHITMDKFMGN